MRLQLLQTVHYAAVVTKIEDTCPRLQLNYNFVSSLWTNLFLSLLSSLKKCELSQNILPKKI